MTTRRPSPWARAHSWGPGARSERGSAAIEAAVGVPAFALFVGLILFGGRTAVTHQAVESAAADAARAATIERTGAAARTAAQDAASVSLANQDIECLAIDVAVDVSEFARPVGQPASVTVSVTCRLDLSDLSVPGVPGSRAVKATITSPVDTWRQRQ